MPMFTFIEYNGIKTDNRQTNSTFYKSNDVCLQNNVLRRKTY